MATRSPESAIKRILVALGVPQHDLTVIEAATRLAARVRGELVGLFIEDSDLLRLAGLPFAREILHTSSAPRRLDTPGMERALRIHAEAARRRLEESAVQARIPWSFRIARGDLLTELAAMSPESDLLVLGEMERRVRGGGGLGATTRRVLLQASCSVLLKRVDTDLERPVVVLFGESPQHLRALTVAAQLAQRDGKNLVVLTPATDAKGHARLRARAQAHLRALGMEAAYRRLADTTPAAIAGAIEQADGKLLVLPGDPGLLDGSQGQGLLDALKCAVVLVR